MAIGRRNHLCTCRVLRVLQRDDTIAPQFQAVAAGAIFARALTLRRRFVGMDESSRHL
jgi:hypothetical protein